MGLKKHGVGEIIETESEQRDLSKTASDQHWSVEDEEELNQEDNK